MNKTFYVTFFSLFIFLIFFAGFYTVKNRLGDVIESKIIHNDIVEDTISDFELLYSAVCFVESNNNCLAVGKNLDYGILQITPVYVKEANRIMGYEYFTHDEAFCPLRSREMFDVVQGHHNPDKDILKAIRLQNKSENYKKRVLKEFYTLKNNNINILKKSL